MSNLNVTLQLNITITQVASIAITAIINTYTFINSNKEKYVEFFNSVLRYMDSMEISNSPLTGKQKKDAVLTKLKELALELLFNWEEIVNVVSSLIDDAKTIYNQMVDARDSMELKLKTIKLQ